MNGIATWQAGPVPKGVSHLGSSPSYSFSGLPAVPPHLPGSFPADTGTVTWI